MSPQAMTFKATSMNLMDAVGTAGGIRRETADGEALYVIRGAKTWPKVRPRCSS